MNTTPILRAPHRFAAQRLSGHWQAQAVPLEADFCPHALPQRFFDVPECCHLQPVLYPEQPYWGDHIRAVNDQAWVFRRTFKSRLDGYRRARLRFEGVDYWAQVWVNDKFVGQHEGHFAPFELDVTPYLRADESTLTVRVSAPWDAPNPAGTFPTDHVIRGLIKGLYEHGDGMIPPAVNPIGIWRPVWLLRDQGVSIDHMRIQTDLSGRVTLDIRLANATPERWQGSISLMIEPENHDGQGVSARCAVSVPPGIHTLHYTLDIPDVHWWWCWDQGSPDLYCLEVSLLDDEQMVSVRHETFGVRTVRLERSPQRFTYVLNERPVFIRGTAYIPSLYLSQYDEETLAHDVKSARDANLNLLRLHVHVSPPELYALCDRAGMLIWQDFELNWIHDPSPEFEQRARTLQHDMIELLGNHPSIITWTCHNEPTMIFTRRRNLERRPDPALYADACQQDPTRPVFICSGQAEDDWQRSGDTHSYYGALWTRRYTDVYRHHPRLNTEFGVEAPAALETLRVYPEVWDRLKHLDGQIDRLWAYQAEFVQYQVEHFRRLRAQCCGGYIHFWLIDLVPQVGCGVLDSCRAPKGGYEALRRASQPLLPILEHDGRRPVALWVLNDELRVHPGAVLQWQIEDAEKRVLLEGKIDLDIAANTAQRVLPIRWSVAPEDCARITLRLCQANGTVLTENIYRQPFCPLPRPDGFPWKFDPYLGAKVYDRPDAPSLADQSAILLLKHIPLKLRESVAEWIMRQRLPVWILSLTARLADLFLG